jgi:hypothetical protein
VAPKSALTSPSLTGAPAVAGERTLLLEQRVESDVERCVAIFGMDRDRHVNRDRFILADSIDAVVALILDRGVPPATEVDHMIGRGDREADAGGGSARRPNSVATACANRAWTARSSMKTFAFTKTPRGRERWSTGADL